MKIEPIIKIPLYKEKYYDITKYDTNNTKNRKRYTFVNANFFSILINDKYYTMPEYITDFNAHQLCFYNLENKLVLERPILSDEDKKSNFIKAFSKYTIMDTYSIKKNLNNK